MRIFRRLLFAGVAAALVPVLVATTSVIIAAKMTGAKSSSELVTNAQQHLQTIRGYYDAVGEGKIPNPQPDTAATLPNEPVKRTHDTPYRRRLARRYASPHR